MMKARLRRLENKLLPTIKDAGGMMLQLHQDGTGTDPYTGCTYTAAEITQRNRTGKGWLLTFRTVDLPKELPPWWPPYQANADCLLR